MAQNRVEAVERALTILEVFDTDRENFTLAELAQHTGFYKSTLLRLLASLARFGYVQREEDGRWQLGPTPARLARRHPPSRRLADRIQPVLDWLATSSGETAALLETSAGRVQCKLVALPDTSLRHNLTPGSHWTMANADPALSLPGGTMLCRALPGESDGAGLWLALSGPAGRLEAAAGETWLEAALARLTTRKLDDPATLENKDQEAAP